MNVKFNSLFQDVPSGKYYDLKQNDDIGLDPRIKENPLILNYDKDNLEYQNYLDERRYGSLPVTLISGRPCSTQLCTSNKFCDSSGRPQILERVPLTCDNDFLPSAQKGNPARYSENIDLESRLLNMDYKTQNSGCGTKNFKEKNSKSMVCFKDSGLLSDRLSFDKNKTFKHDKKNNRQCKKYIPDLGFGSGIGASSKRINNVNW